jgi:hypothetical protein
MAWMRKIVREIFLRRRNPCRYIIERKILPKIRNQKVLFVGVANYTSDYPKRLKTNDLWTIDTDPSVAKYGARKHITDRLSNIGKHLPASSLDVILMFGIFGYGLNTKIEAEKTMEACSKVLKPGGIMVIQWSDKLGKNPIDPSKLRGFKYFKRKEMFGFPGTLRTKGKRVWEFLVKI